MGSTALDRRSSVSAWWAQPAVRRIAGIAGLGLAVRVGYVLLAKSRVDTCGTFLCGDAFYYSASAKFLAAGRGFTLPDGAGAFLPAADHPPLTTILLAPVSFIEADATHLPQRLVMALLGAAVIVGLGLLARRLAGDGAGAFAAGIAALNPNLFMNDVVVMAETVAAACLVALLTLTYRYRERPGIAAAALVGAAVGLAGLARAELLLYGPVMVLPVILLARELPWRRRLGHLVLAGSVAVGVLVPWTVHNATRFEEPVLLSTNDGLTLLGANCDAVYGTLDPGGIGFWSLTCADPVDAQLAAGVDQSQRSAAYRDAAVRYIGDNLDRLPEVVAHRLGRGWGVVEPAGMVWLNQGEGRDTWASWAGYLTWWLLVPLAGIGAWHLRRARVLLWPLLSSIAVVTITLVAFYGIVRFRLPADISATVLAGIALDRLFRRWRPRGSAAPADRSADPAPSPVAPPTAQAGAHTAHPAQALPTAVPELSGGTHFPCLDAYRGIGMTMVLLNHAAYSTGFVFRSDLGPYIARLDVSVPMFFVMSGFLLFRPYALAILEERPLPDLGRFYRRRVLRIIPAYWVALVGLGVLVGLQIPTVADWIANALLLPAFGVPAQVCSGAVCRTGYGITQAWSIGVEAAFYLAVPLIALAVASRAARTGGPRRRRSLLGATVLLYGVGAGFRLLVVVLDPAWAPSSLLWLPMYLDLFAIGMALAVVSGLPTGSIPSPLRYLADRPWLCWGIAGSLYLLMTQFTPPDEPFGLNGAEYVPRQFVYGLLSACWLLPALFGDQREGRLRKVLASAPLVYLGTVSLSFYLWHLAIIEQVKAWVVPDYQALVALAADPPPGNELAALATFTGPFVVVAGGAWVLSLAIASVLYRYVELPFLQRKDGWPGRRRNPGGRAPVHDRARATT